MSNTVLDSSVYNGDKSSHDSCFPAAKTKYSGEYSIEFFKKR